MTTRAGLLSTTDPALASLVNDPVERRRLEALRRPEADLLKAAYRVMHDLSHLRHFRFAAEEYAARDSRWLNGRFAALVHAESADQIQPHAHLIDAFAREAGLRPPVSKEIDPALLAQARQEAALMLGETLPEAAESLSTAAEAPPPPVLPPEAPSAAARLQQSAAALAARLRGTSPVPSFAFNMRVGPTEDLPVDQRDRSIEEILAGAAIAAEKYETADDEVEDYDSEITIADGILLAAGQLEALVPPLAPFLADGDLQAAFLAGELARLAAELRDLESRLS